MTLQPLSSAARAGAGSSAARSANNGAPDAETWTFRAPRHGDLVACPYCANRLTACCDYCGDESQLFAIDLEKTQ